jgi:hypothetical protein
VEPPSFYWNLLVYPLARERSFAAVRLAALLLLSHAANTLGFCRQWRAHGKER